MSARWTLWALFAICSTCTGTKSRGEEVDWRRVPILRSRRGVRVSRRQHQALLVVAAEAVWRHRWVSETSRDWRMCATNRPQSRISSVGAGSLLQAGKDSSETSSRIWQWRGLKGIRPPCCPTVGHCEPLLHSDRAKWLDTCMMGKHSCWRINHTPPTVCHKQAATAAQEWNFPIFLLIRHSGSFSSSLWPPTVCIVEKINNTMCTQLGNFPFTNSFDLRTLLVLAPITGAHQTVWIYLNAPGPVPSCSTI